MKAFIYICFCLAILSCNARNNTSAESNINVNTQEMDRIHTDTILKLALQDAIDKYGKPESRTLLNTSEDITSEFRIELRNFYSETELEEGIAIEELTWSLDKDNNITIWYENRADKWVPKHHLIWDKQSEF